MAPHKEIAIFTVSCRVCGEKFSALSLNKAKDKHHEHIKECRILSFWEKANKILDRELSAKEVFKLLGI